MRVFVREKDDIDTTRLPRVMSGFIKLLYLSDGAFQETLPVKQFGPSRSDAAGLGQLRVALRESNAAIVQRDRFAGFRE